jgi:glycosyltransferase involved in cell wall biosynthesis
VPEVITSGEHALVVPPNDVKALAEAVLQLLSAPALRHRLALTGRQLVLERFSETNLVERVIRVYARAYAQSN